MTPLSPLTQSVIQKFFPQNTEEVKHLLEEECGQNLPFCENSTPESLQRIRFAVLKIGAGKMDAFHQALDMAKLDWRDLLVWAEFAEDLEAHMKWTDQILKP